MIKRRHSTAGSYSLTTGLHARYNACVTDNEGGNAGAYSLDRTEQSLWLDDLTERIARDYERASRQFSQSGGTSNQEAGHRGETAWKEVLEEWLPPQYEVGVRKYILADSSENAARSRETDLVIYHPSYPRGLRKRPQVLASGIVAALSVKMTLDASGVREACESAAELRRLLPPPPATVRDELLSPIMYGVLAHSHSWKASGSDPTTNIERVLEANPPTNPREWLDVVCVADLACWSRLTIVLPDHVVDAISRQTKGAVSDQPSVQEGLARTDDSSPIGVLIAFITGRFAQFDPTLRPIAAGLRGLLPDTTAASKAGIRWPLNHVLNEETREGLRTIANGSPEWDLYYY